MGNKKRDRRNQKDVTKYQMDLEMHDCCDNYLEKTKKKDYSLIISQDVTVMVRVCLYRLGWVSGSLASCVWSELMGCHNARVSNDMLSNSIATSDVSNRLCYDVLLWLCSFFCPLCTVCWLMFPFTSTPKILPTDLITFPIFHLAHPLFMRSHAISRAWVV